MRIRRVDPERWYDIPGYDGKYQINYLGEVRRSLKNGKYKNLNPYRKKRSGKMAIKLNCKERDMMRVMGDTFIGALPEGYVMYHKNGLLSDNALCNLGVTTREKLGRLTGQRNDCKIAIVKIDQNGEIVECYRSVREAGRKNFMSYQTILNRINGKTKGLCAPDGYIYARDNEKELQRVLRRLGVQAIEEV